MSEFRPKLSLSPSQKQEERSIDCLRQILSESEYVKTHFTSNDKIPDVDGKIELLDENMIYGNITVQIKTLPNAYYEDPKFPCPTSLFGYAQRCINEVVCLIAVNNQNQVAYWMIIDNELITQNLSKTNQSTITLKFSDEHRLDKNNVEDVVNKWKVIFANKCSLILRSIELSRTNERLQNIFQTNSEPLPFDKVSIIKVQQFIDEFNYLLDHKFKIVKDIFFFNSWKTGIALSSYKENEISMFLYEIRWGENDTFIKFFPSFDFKALHNYSLAYMSYIKNPINKNPEDYALQLIKRSIDRILDGDGVFFLTEETAIEYIYDFIDSKKYLVKSDDPDLNVNLLLLKEELQSEFPRIEEINCNIVCGKSTININVLFNSVMFLLNRSITSITRLYPKKGLYGDTGLIFDFYSPEIAYSKLSYLYERLPNLYNQYLDSLFPLLTDELAFFTGFDLMLVNLSYTNGDKNLYSQNHRINIYYLESDQSSVDKKIVTSLNFESEFYSENRVYSHGQLIEKCFSQSEMFKFEGIFYRLKKASGESIRFLFDNNYLSLMVNKYLKDNLDQYFKNR